jgi:hypothetical protein
MVPTLGPEVQVFDGEINATVPVDGKLVPVSMSPVEITELSSWVDRCGNRVVGVISDLEAVKAHVADDHLPIKNEHWLRDGEPPMSKSEFIGHLQLCGVNFFDDSMDVFFDDGGMFSDHSIIVHFEDGAAPGGIELFG